MRPSKRDILIATRRSRLARAQAEGVGRLIHRQHPRVGMELIPLDSEADRIPDHPLAKYGGKGLFTRSIDRAVLQKQADIAVHSLKDLPTESTPGLVIVATPKRLPAHDVLIAPEARSIDELPEGARVGTSSPRRRGQLLRLRPDLEVVPLRGNVETRIAKVLDRREVDATLLAAAGLERLGLSEHATCPIPVEQVLPAAGQGALAVQIRLDDHISMRRCMPLNDAMTGIAVNAERQVVAALEADCHSPVAVLAEPAEDQQLRLRARVLSPDGSACAEADETGTTKNLRALTDRVVNRLVQQGARQMLREAEQRATHPTPRANPTNHPAGS